MFKRITGLTFAFVMAFGLVLSPATAEENVQEVGTPAVEAAPPAEEADQEAIVDTEIEAEETKEASADE